MVLQKKASRANRKERGNEPIIVITMWYSSAYVCCLAVAIPCKLGTINFN